MSLAKQAVVAWAMVAAWAAFFFMSAQSGNDLSGLDGITDEICQIFIPGRFCDSLDWVVDTAGAFLGAATVAKAYEGKRKRGTLGSLQYLNAVIFNWGSRRTPVAKSQNRGGPFGGVVARARVAA